MARCGPGLLDTNDSFPQITLQLINGEMLNLPDEKGDGYAVLFFYRGYW
jgi:peroxiredoxin